MSTFKLEMDIYDMCVSIDASTSGSMFINNGTILGKVQDLLNDLSLYESVSVKIEKIPSPEASVEIEDDNTALSQTSYWYPNQLDLFKDDVLVDVPDTVFTSNLNLSDCIVDPYDTFLPGGNYVNTITITPRN